MAAGQAQAQFGPGSQEIGGFWPAAASALAKGARLPARCGPVGAVAGCCRPDGESATLWQAWQAEQFSQPESAWLKGPSEPVALP